MPARRATRPNPGHSLNLPRVDDDSSQRAFDRIGTAVSQIRRKLDGAVRGTGTRAAPPPKDGRQVGDIVFNTDPVAGGKVGWVYVEGGEWKAFGAIDP